MKNDILFAGSIYKKTTNGYIKPTSKRKGKYHYYFTNPLTQKQTSRALSANTYEDAISEANGLFQSFGAGGASAASSTSLSLAEFWDKYEDLEHGLSFASMDDYRGIFRIFANWAKANGIDNATDVDGGIARKYAKYVGARKTTARRDFSVLRTVWRVCGYVETNPWDMIGRPAIKPREAGDKSRALTVEEVRRLHAECVASAEMGLGGLARDAMSECPDAIVLMWYYGFRIGSIAALKIKDFDLSKGWFYHTPPKTEKARPDPLKLPLGIPEVDEVIRRRLAAAPKNAVHLFPHISSLYHTLSAKKEGTSFQARRAATRYGQSCLSQAIKRVFERAGVLDNAEGRASLHGIRKSLACNLLMNGTPDAVVKSIAGWGSDSDMLCRYGHIQTVEVKRKAILDGVPPLLQKEAENDRHEAA